MFLLDITDKLEGCFCCCYPTEDLKRWWFSALKLLSQYATRLPANNSLSCFLLPRHKHLTQAPITHTCVDSKTTTGPPNTVTWKPSSPAQAAQRNRKAPESVKSRSHPMQVGTKLWRVTKGFLRKHFIPFKLYNHSQDRYCDLHFSEDCTDLKHLSSLARIIHLEGRAGTQSNVPFLLWSLFLSEWVHRRHEIEIWGYISGQCSWLKHVTQKKEIHLTMLFYPTNSKKYGWKLNFQNYN